MRRTVHPKALFQSLVPALSNAFCSGPLLSIPFAVSFVPTDGRGDSPWTVPKTECNRGWASCLPSFPGTPFQTVCSLLVPAKIHKILVFMAIYPPSHPVAIKIGPHQNRPDGSKSCKGVHGTRAGKGLYAKQRRNCMFILIYHSAFRGRETRLGARAAARVPLAISRTSHVLSTPEIAPSGRGGKRQGMLGKGEYRFFPCAIHRLFLFRA